MHAATHAGRPVSQNVELPPERRGFLGSFFRQVTLGVSTVGLNQSWTEAVEMIFLHLVQKFHILSSSLSQITAHINRNLSKKGSLRASLLQPAFRRVFVWKWCPSTIRHVTRCRSRPLDRSVTPTDATGRNLYCRWLLSLLPCVAYSEPYSVACCDAHGSTCGPEHPAWVFHAVV